MKVEQMENASEIKQSGRNFLTVIEGIKDNDMRARIEAMREGDFINMSGKDFKRWLSSIPDEDEDALERLDELDEVKVEIIEIRNTENEFNNKSEKLLVKGGGVRKEVFASLFYNYGSHDGYKELVFDGEVGGFDNSSVGSRSDIDIRK